MDEARERQRVAQRDRWQRRTGVPDLFSGAGGAKGNGVATGGAALRTFFGRGAGGSGCVNSLPSPSNRSIVNCSSPCIWRSSVPSG
jgi:hypothetical protein